MPSVDIITIGKVASSLVAIVCLFSVTIGGMTGFFMIYPPISILGGIVALGFYGIGMFMERKLGTRSGHLG